MLQTETSVSIPPQPSKPGSIDVTPKAIAKIRAAIGDWKKKNHKDHDHVVMAAAGAATAAN